MLLLTDAGSLDYAPCRYGASKAVFRGPARDLSGNYLAMLGGTQTFGKYVQDPYPSLVEKVTGQRVVNLAGLGAGPDFYLDDLPALRVAAEARLAVVQLPGAETMSNPFYTVHGRRNDRILTPTQRLRALFPEVDFAETLFARHLLTVLQDADHGRFQTVVAGLKRNWLATMRQLLVHLPLRRVLLWLADAMPPKQATAIDGSGPLLVDEAMIVEVLQPGTRLVTAIPSAAARALGVTDMLFPETEAVQAHCLPGAAVHAEIAARLVPAIAELSGK
ncbi:MAG: hypothetical protein JNN02_00655 [Tabrizicola sp.]|nr:hypothetical protein [Tabrizicola sp.]